MTAAKAHLEFLLEGESDEVVLAALLPKIVPEGVTYTLHAFQGKRNLMKKLWARLRGYRVWLPPDWKIVILCDDDLQDCSELKENIRTIVAREKLSIFSNTDIHKEGAIVIRLAIQEIEAWFFGDDEALWQAYPRLSRKPDQKKKYRQPDAIASPWKKLEKILQNAGYDIGGKREVARTISPFLEPSRNRSRSFQVFWQTLMTICEQ